MPARSTSYFSVSMFLTILTTDLQEISCSVERPPKTARSVCFMFLLPLFYVDIILNLLIVSCGATALPDFILNFIMLRQNRAAFLSYHIWLRMKPPSDRRAADNLPVQPFHAQIAMQEYDSPQGPVYSHSDPHRNRTDMENTNQDNSQNDSRRPHRDA